MYRLSLLPENDVSLVFQNGLERKNSRKTRYFRVEHTDGINSENFETKWICVGTNMRGQKRVTN